MLVSKFTSVPEAALLILSRKHFGKNGSILEADTHSLDDTTQLDRFTSMPLILLVTVPIKTTVYQRLLLKLLVHHWHALTRSSRENTNHSD